MAPRGAAPRRLLAAGVLSLSLLAVIPAPVVGQIIPTPPVPLPSTPPGPGVPDPLPPAPGNQPGTPAQSCTHAPPGPTEIRTLYAGVPDSHSNSPLQPASTFAIESEMPCRIYRTLADRVQRSDAAGAANTWVDAFIDPGTRTTPQRPSVLSPVVPAGGHSIYVYDKQGANGVYFSADAGQTWANRNNGLFVAGLQGLSGPTSGISAFAVAPSLPSQLYLVGSANGQTLVYRSSDGGASWNPAPGQARIPEVTSLAIDPADPSHLYVAAGGPETATGSQTAPNNTLFESHDSGQNWATVTGAAKHASPSAVWTTRASNGSERVYIRSAFIDQKTGQFGGQDFLRSDDDGSTWHHIGTPATLGLGADLTFNPFAPDQMVIAGPGTDNQGKPVLTILGSVDGFNTVRYQPVFSKPNNATVTAVEARADSAGDIFVQSTYSGTDELVEFQIRALDSNGSGSGTRAEMYSCPLPTINGQTAVAGSITFDGVYLDYTQDEQAPGVIFRIDPYTCRKGGQIPQIRLDLAYTGNVQSALYSLTFDPSYQFGNGHVGAILARGAASGSFHDPRVPDGYAAVYAVDAQAQSADIVGAVYCGHGASCSSSGTNVFAFDPYSQRLWARSGDPINGGVIGPLTLAAPGSAAPLPAAATCMSTFSVPGDDMSSWVFGARDIIYVQMEFNNTTVVRVDTANCRVLDSFTHRDFNEADPNEDDQMACDALTFGEGSPLVQPGTGTSVLWIRDAVANTVAAYAIPDGNCPFPTRLAVDGTPPAQVTTAVTVCATLTSVTTGLPRTVAGVPLQFTLAGAPIGTGVTKDDGQACAPATAPSHAGAAPITAVFAGTAAHMASSGTGSLLVTAPLVSCVTGCNADTPPCSNCADVTHHSVPLVHAPPGPLALQAPVQPLPQAQTQPQAQPQAQSQPATMTQRRTQARVALQGSDGARHELELQASGTRIALVAQVAGLALFAGGLWARSAQLRRRRPSLAHARRTTR
jgi:hypothetical protein